MWTITLHIPSMNCGEIRYACHRGSDYEACTGQDIRDLKILIS